MTIGVTLLELPQLENKSVLDLSGRGLLQGVTNMAIIHSTAKNKNLSKIADNDPRFGFVGTNSFDGLGALLTRYQLMPQFMRGRVIDQAIAQISCTEAERQTAIAQYLQQHQLTSPKAREAWLHNQGISLEQMEELAIRPLLLNKFKLATWGHKTAAYFLAHKQSFDRVIYSMLRTKDRGMAQEIYFRIKEGEQSFSELARQYSQGPEMHTGGVLGPMPLSKPHPAIAKVLSISQPGQLWGPLRLEDWFVIIRLEKFFPAKLDESMRDRLVNELFETWLQEQLHQLSDKDEQPTHDVELTPQASSFSHGRSLVQFDLCSRASKSRRNC